VVFERRPEGALLRRGTQGVHPVDRAFGRLSLGVGVDALMDDMRGSRPAPGRKRGRTRAGRK